MSEFKKFLTEKTAEAKKLEQSWATFQDDLDEVVGPLEMEADMEGDKKKMALYKKGLKIYLKMEQAWKEMEKFIQQNRL